jgi:hypothetical protein
MIETEVKKREYNTFEPVKDSERENVVEKCHEFLSKKRIIGQDFNIFTESMIKLLGGFSFKDNGVNIADKAEFTLGDRIFKFYRMGVDLRKEGFDYSKIIIQKGKHQEILEDLIITEEIVFWQPYSTNAEVSLEVILPERSNFFSVDYLIDFYTRDVGTFKVPMSGDIKLNNVTFTPSNKEVKTLCRKIFEGYKGISSN